MKSIQYYLLLLVTCLLFNGCQEVEEPLNTVPTVVTDDVEKYYAEFAYFSGSVSAKGNYYFLVSTFDDLTEARQVDAYGYKDETGKWVCRAEVGDLSPSTTYYVALCATDGRSEVRGNIVSFTTNGFLEIESVTKDEQSIRFEEIGVYVTNMNNGISHGNVKALIRGGYSYSLEKDITLQEPAYVYAYAPYSGESKKESLEDVEVWANGMTDCLYGRCEVSPENLKANIQMQSAMAKLCFVISTDSKELVGVESINLRNIWSNGVSSNALSTRGKLDLTSGNITWNSDDLSDGYFVKVSDGVIKEGSSVTVEMNVIPSSFDNGEVELNLYVGKMITVSIAASTWEKGKSYEIPIHLELEPKEAKVGDYFYHDGTWSSELDESKEWVGIVYALSKERGDSIDVSLESSMHGRVVALKDIGISIWGTSENVYEEMIMQKVPRMSVAQGGGTIVGRIYASYLPIDGRERYKDNISNNIEKIPYNYEVWPNRSTSDMLQSWEAFLYDYKGESWSHYYGYGDTSAAMCYAYQTGDIKSWYLPAIGELTRLAMAQAYGVLQKNGFTPLEGEYWSSTPSSKNSAWYYATENGYVGDADLPAVKNIRPIVSF